LQHLAGRERLRQELVDAEGVEVGGLRALDRGGVEPADAVGERAQRVRMLPARASRAPRTFSQVRISSAFWLSWLKTGCSVGRDARRISSTSSMRSSPSICSAHSSTSLRVSGRFQ
jgi:hypothetical protein